MTYTIMNDNDPLDTFDVEADSAEEAAFKALNELGWAVCEPNSDEEATNDLETFTESSPSLRATPPSAT